MKTKKQDKETNAVEDRKLGLVRREDEPFR